MSRQVQVIPKLDRDVAIYLAGLFDGEGAFMLHATEYRSRMKYNARIRIAMSDKITMQWVAEKLNRPVKLHGLGRNANPNAKTIYRVNIEDGGGNYFTYKTITSLSDYKETGSYGTCSVLYIEEGYFETTQLS